GRNQGICPRRRRLHREYWPDSGWRSEAWRGVRSRDGTVARGIRRKRRLGRGGERPRGNQDPAQMRKTDRGRIEVAPQSGDRGLPSTGGRRVRVCRDRVVAQILPRRRGAGRHLPAGIPDQRMGHGGGPRDLAGCWGPGRRTRWGNVAIWKARLSQPRICGDLRLEAALLGAVPRILLRRRRYSRGSLAGLLLGPWKRLHPFRTGLAGRLRRSAQCQRLDLIARGLDPQMHLAGQWVLLPGQLEPCDKPLRLPKCLGKL